MVTIELQRGKETKNKWRYEHPDFGALYVPKPTVIALGNPDRITLTITAGGVAHLAEVA